MRPIPVGGNNMRTIWKWPLYETDVQELSVPADTRFFHVECQDRELMVWGLGDPNLGRRGRSIAIVGTGNRAPTDDEARYIGTAHMPTGLVWHVFEKIEEEA